MSARNKSYIGAAALLLLALGILLRPPAPRSAMVLDRPAERSRSATRPPKPATDPRRAKDFQTVVRGLNQGETPELTRQEIDNFLEVRHRSAGSLLASRRVTARMETPSVPESDWLLYFDRAKLFGEKAANDWMLGKYPDL